jgi:hypothetical protein
VNTNDPSGFLPLGLAGSSFFCLPGYEQFATEPVTMTESRTVDNSVFSPNRLTIPIDLSYSSL